jgi:hypothetical protein
MSGFTPCEDVLIVAPPTLTFCASVVLPCITEVTNAVAPEVDVLKGVQPVCLQTPRDRKSLNHPDEA